MLKFDNESICTNFLVINKSDKYQNGNTDIAKIYLVLELNTIV